MNPGTKVIIDGDVRGTVVKTSQDGSTVIVNVGHAIMSVNWDRVVELA